MKKINLSITGCMGRMGQQLIKTCKKDKKVNLLSITENRSILKKIHGVLPQFNTEEAFKNTDVIIDFTVPQCTLEVLRLASKLKKRVVIGTTGFTKKEENLIKSYSKKIPILKAGNMSLGINLLMYLTEITAKVLGDKYLSKILEFHHKHKKDYPSGTALMLGKGMPFMRRGDYGDLYVQIKTEVPVYLNKQQKELLEKFREIENDKSNPSIKKFFQKAKSFWKN